MRDIALVLVLAAMLPLVLRFPFVGVYLWEWMALMNPHRLVYSFAEGQPFNMVIAIVTLFAWVFWTQRDKVKVTPFMVLIVLFSIWISVTTYFAPVPGASEPLWERNIKTMLLLLLILSGITNRVRLHGLVWIVVISIGFWGVRGGGFTILHGGNYRVFGPAASMIADNNSLALALIMVLPLMNYLRLHSRDRWLRRGLVACMIPVLASIVGSYSRGGLIAMGAMLLFLGLKSRAKVATMFIGAIAVSATLLIMPDKYFQRVETIGDATQDSSFQGRLDAWTVAWKVALHRPLGAGFDGPRQEQVWNRYLPDKESRASHSIYFMVLGEHGFVGLGLYLLILSAAWRNLSRVIRLTRERPELLWAKDMAAALQVSMVGFMVGGAALPMAYYDGFLTLLAMTVPLRAVVEARVPAERPRWRKAQRRLAPALPGTPVPGAASAALPTAGAGCG
jgi:probable O-glycosylation ligase (exosortase A-associated)